MSLNKTTCKFIGFSLTNLLNQKKVKFMSSFLNQEVKIEWKNIDSHFYFQKKDFNKKIIG